MSDQPCKYCGYDLRQSPRYCPECGRERAVQRSWVESLAWKAWAKRILGALCLLGLSVVLYPSIKSMWGTYRYAAWLQQNPPPSVQTANPSLFSVAVGSVAYSQAGAFEVRFSVTATKRVLIDQAWPEYTKVYVVCGGTTYRVAMSTTSRWNDVMVDLAPLRYDIPVGPHIPPAEFRLRYIGIGTDYKFYPMTGFPWPEDELRDPLQKVILVVETLHEAPNGKEVLGQFYTSEYSGKIDGE